MKKTFILLITFICFTVGSALSLASDEGTVTVLVAPFQIQSEAPLDYVAQALPPMLSSRLDAEDEIKTLDAAVASDAIARLNLQTLDEANARLLGRETNADWVILGTITQRGEEISLETTLIDTTAEKPTLTESYQEKSLKELMDGVSVFAKRVGNKILGKVLVAGVTVQGNRLVEEAAVLNQIEMKTGSVFTQENLQKDIRNIYDMGFFNDIKVDSTDELLGKKIVFIVKENPEILEIKITGNQEVDISEIQKQVDIKPHTILNLNKAKDNAVKIKKFYQGKGYYNALVDYVTEEVSPEQATLVFQIVEHHPMKIKKVAFKGNKHLKTRNLKKIIETREKNLLSFITDAGTFKDDALKLDRDRITAYYYDNGYLDVKVGEPDVTHDEKWFYITFRVEEGNQYTVSDVGVGGDVIETKEPLEKSIKVKQGEIFSRQKIQDDITAITDIYGEYGYAYVDITPLTNIDADAKTVALTYDIAKGEEVYFEKITITGNTKTRDKVIRRELRVKEEDLYNNKKLKRSRERVNNLGYFEDVKINTKKGSAPNKVDLEVNVKEKPTGMISAGAGYSTVDNVVGIFQVAQSNFLGKGLRASVMAQLGEASRFRLALVQPYLFDKEISVGFDLYKMETFYEDFDSESQGISLSAGFLPFGKEDWNLTFTYGLSSVDISNLDRYGVYDTSVDPPTLRYIVYDVDSDIYEAEQDSPITISSLTTSLSRDTIDDRFYPMRGSSNALSLELAGLGGEKFAKAIVDSRWYFPFKWGTAFMTRGSAGYARGYGGDDIPVFERFFLGGLDTLRGFEYRMVGPKGKITILPPSLGPENDILSGDTVIGGDKMMFFNFEYLFPILKAAKIRGLVFFDMGNAFAEGESFKFDFRKSAGFGVRWNSPFGPLRVEWGLNLDPEDDERGSVFEFSAGAGF